MLKSYLLYQNYITIETNFLLIKLYLLPIIVGITKPTTGSLRYLTLFFILKKWCENGGITIRPIFTITCYGLVSDCVAYSSTTQFVIFRVSEGLISITPRSTFEITITVIPVNCVISRLLGIAGLGNSCKPKGYAK